MYRCLMTERNLLNLRFQTFFVSHEQSTALLVSDIIRAGKNLEKKGVLEDSQGVISLEYGKRMLITGNYASIQDLKREDIVEIVDYDPVKKNALVIGQNQPDVETPVHWLIHHAREDVHAVVQLNSKKLLEKLSKNLPVTEEEHPPGSLELAKEVLKTLRRGKRIVIKNKGALFVGASLSEVEGLVLTTNEELK